MNLKLVFAATLLASGAAFAQNAAPQYIGTTSEVQGLVTVSTGSQLATATQGLPFTDKTQFVTGSNSFATLTLNSGCVLRMRPNQSIVVDQSKSCKELLALLEEGGRGAAAVQAAGASPNALGIFAGAAGLAIIAAGGGNGNNNGNVPGGGGNVPGGGGNVPGGGGNVPGGGGGIPIPPISGQ